MTDLVPESSSRPYGLEPLTMVDARHAVERVHGEAAAGVWAELLDAAGLSGDEGDRDALVRLLDGMSRDADPVTALCADALGIRLVAYDNLSAAHAFVRKV